MLRQRVAGVFVLLLVSGAGLAEAQVDAHAGHALGKVEFPTSCSPQAQAAFDRAVALLHHMTYPQAREAFERVAAADPRCAMAHWGVAMTLFQPLWPTRPKPAELQRGFEEAQEAEALHPPTERERLFVASVSAFFLEPASTDYWLRIRRWEQAAEKLYVAFPDDPEAATFYALAHLATAPSNTISHAHQDRAAEILMRVYRRNPDHPGAMHYLVHANDAPGRERESLEITRRYEALAPRNPHALHMPTHIYTRLGDWDGVIRGNLKAAEAALEYPAGDHGELVWDEFPHAIEYLVYAYLQQGRDDAAHVQVQRLRGTGGSSRASRRRSTSRRPRPGMRWSGATGSRRPRSSPASPRRSTGTASRGPRRSRGSRAAWARRAWGTAPRLRPRSIGWRSSRRRPTRRRRSCSPGTSACSVSSSARGWRTSRAAARPAWA